MCDHHSFPAVHWLESHSEVMLVAHVRQHHSSGVSSATSMCHQTTAQYFQIQILWLVEWQSNELRKCADDQQELTKLHHIESIRQLDKLLFEETKAKWAESGGLCKRSLITRLHCYTDFHEGQCYNLQLSIRQTVTINLSYTCILEFRVESMNVMSCISSIIS